MTQALLDRQWDNVFDHQVWRSLVGVLDTDGDGRVFHGEFAAGGYGTALPCPPRSRSDPRAAGNHLYGPPV
ncbi:hypothetical protein ACIRG5_05520 [Lentzea sp. NPDC102401]|uniref:hypothetical protein n=1 Tax=Lentzea sp. NPDC102401 TaxID=3364128 RepID=UPI00380CB4EC